METVTVAPERSVPLRLAGTTVAEYVLRPELDPTLSPRPYLHPVRTLRGVTVTDLLPADHRWHLGASLAVPDVDGSNLWGGRTYVRGSGYTWRDDHGRIVHDRFLDRRDDRLASELRWCSPTGGTLLTEARTLAAEALPGSWDGWLLTIGYTLTAPPDRAVTLGSPATNGRPGGTGYGGFFWRAAPGDRPPAVFSATATGEDRVNGTAEDWVALVSGSPAYGLLFRGLAAGERWFVRSTMYPGVCAAFAFTRPLVIPAGGTVAGRHQVAVLDGGLTGKAARELADALQ